MMKKHHWGPHHSRTGVSARCGVLPMVLGGFVCSGHELEGEWLTVAHTMWAAKTDSEGRMRPWCCQLPGGESQTLAPGVLE
jgi:hypothetical protein